MRKVARRGFGRSLDGVKERRCWGACGPEILMTETPDFMPAPDDKAKIVSL